MNKKLSKRRENGLLAFGLDLSTVLKSLQKEKISLFDIKDNWKNFGSEEYFSHLVPVAYKTGRLDIKAGFGPIAMMAMAHKDVIKEKINTFFGKEFIKDIKIIQ